MPGGFHFSALMLYGYMGQIPVYHYVDVLIHGSFTLDVGTRIIQQRRISQWSTHSGTRKRGWQDKESKVRVYANTPMQVIVAWFKNYITRAPSCASLDCFKGNAVSWHFSFLSPLNYEISDFFNVVLNKSCIQIVATYLPIWMVEHQTVSIWSEWSCDCVPIDIGFKPTAVLKLRVS